MIFVSRGNLDCGVQVRGKEPSGEATATDQVRAGDDTIQSSSKGGGKIGLDSGSILKIDPRDLLTGRWHAGKGKAESRATPRFWP